MLESLKRFSKGIDEIEVKILGGANLISSNGGGQKTITIGEQNINQAHKKIEETNLKIKSFDTGGSIGRKIYFHTDSGDVYLKKIKKTEIEKTKSVLIG